MNVKIKTIALYMGLLIAVGFTQASFAVDCSASSITVTTQQDVDDFQSNYGSCNTVAAIITAANPVIFVDVNTVADSSCVIGQCWDHAFTNLQDALATATSGDDIWVANGVYYPDEGGTQTGGDVFASFTLIDGVSVYGGFDGSETDVNQRNPELNVTILSGDIFQDDIYVNADNIVVTTDNIVDNNSYHVLIGSAVVDTNTVLDGFTITAGKAVGVANNENRGAGMSCGNALRGPHLNNLIFIGNMALIRSGATEYCTQKVTNTSFINNSSISTGSGGAVFARGGYYENVNFVGNSTDTDGGAIKNEFRLLTLKNVTFSANQSRLKGGALYSVSDVILDNVLFQGNKAGNDSDYHGGALFIDGLANAELTNATFTGNKAGNLGGAIGSASTGALDIRNSIIWNNQDSTGQDTLSASIISQESGLTTISNSLIQGSGGSLNWDMTAGIDGGNNLDQDPLFITDTDPTIAPTSVGDARLMDMSIAIDAGDDSFVTTATDLDGLDRIQGTSVDMGAYETISKVIFKDGFE